MTKSGISDLSFISLFSESEFSDQPIAPAIALAAAFAVPKYIEEDLQQILKIVREVQAPTTFEEPWDKLLKAHSLDIYCRKFYIRCYNFC